MSDRSDQPPARFMPWADRPPGSIDPDSIDPDPVPGGPDEDAQAGPQVGGTGRAQAPDEDAQAGRDDAIRILTRQPRTLAEGLRAALAITGVTAGELAAATGMHRNSIGNYIGGGTRPRIPRADALWKLCVALAPRLDLRPDELWAEFGRLIRDTNRV